MTGYAIFGIFIFWVKFKGELDFKPKGEVEFKFKGELECKVKEGLEFKDKGEEELVFMFKDELGLGVELITSLVGWIRFIILEWKTSGGGVVVLLLLRVIKFEIGLG